MENLTNQDVVQTASTSESSIIQLFEIEGSMKSTKNFYDNQGFVYTKTKAGATDTSYFRCKNSERFNYRARAIVYKNEFEKAVLTWKHTHPHEQKILDKVIFDKKFDQFFRENPFASPYCVYLKTKRCLKEMDPLNVPLFRQYKSFIHRRQKEDIPLLPKSISEFVSLIDEEKYKHYYWFDEREMLFYRGVWTSGKGASNIVYISESVLQQIKKMDNVVLLMDGTFKVIPVHIKFRQLYIISVVINLRSYPLAFILMEKKDFHSYDVIFENLKLLLPLEKVSNCMTDYEAATRKALRKHFPKSRISGCYFHYVQAMVKATKRFGLKKDDQFKAAIQELSALALLPNNFVLEGFEIISRQFSDSDRWNRFKEYWLKQWKNANISVYGLQHRTNNFAESLNKIINLLIKRRHQNIWILIENLKLLEMDRSDEMKKNVAVMMIKTKENQEMKRLNAKIVDATKLFDDDVDVASFLKHVTYNDKMETFFKERIAVDDDDTIDADEDDDNGDDEVIPNDFNVESDFRREHPRQSCNLIKSFTSTQNSSNKKQRR